MYASHFYRKKQVIRSPVYWSKKQLVGDITGCGAISASFCLSPKIKEECVRKK